MFDLSDPEERYEYTAEKATLAGSFIGSILYGTPTRTFVYLRSLRFFGLS